MLSLMDCFKSRCGFGKHALFIFYQSPLYMYEWVPQGFVWAEFPSILPQKNYSEVHKTELLKSDYSCLSRRKDSVMNIKSIPSKL